MKRHLVCLLASGCMIALLAAAPPTNAALISADLNAPGDGLLTRDTVSGLEWLDVTQTAGFSFDEIVSGAGGFKDLGFRPANGPELLSVLTQLGFTGFLGSGPELYQPALDFIALFGCISECGFAAAFPATGGLFDEPSPTDPSLKQFLIIQVNNELARAAIFPGAIAPNASSAALLVRDVPEPRPIFALATFVLVLWLGAWRSNALWTLVVLLAAVSARDVVAQNAYDGMVHVGGETHRHASSAIEAKNFVDQIDNNPPPHPLLHRGARSPAKSQPGETHFTQIPLSEPEEGACLPFPRTH
jgi:hypothetical protein